MKVNISFCGLKIVHNFPQAAQAHVKTARTQPLSWNYFIKISIIRIVDISGDVPVHNVHTTPQTNLLP